MVDLLSHMLWAYALFHAQAAVAYFVFFTLLPDAIWALPAIALFIASGQSLDQWRKTRWRGDKNANKLPHFKLVSTLYHFSHSWLVMGILCALVAALFPALSLAFAGGVFLHLALDLLLHKGSPFGQFPLYPLSGYKVDGFIHWSDRRVIAANYALLAAVYALIFLHFL